MFFKGKKKKEEPKGIPMEEREKIGAKDTLALLISAFFVLVLPCVLVVLGLALIVLLLFGVL